MDLDIAFGENTMRIPVYIKTDTHDQLLLSEGVYRQLSILKVWRGRTKLQLLPELKSPPKYTYE